jgi:cytoskeletal protein CcmA (bactofilin family)
MSDPYDTVKGRTSILGPTIQFKGDLSADEDLIIRGRVEGTVKHSQRLTVGAGGQVLASVEAKLVIVEGTVDGDIRAESSVSVRDQAHVTGNIVAPSVTIQEGARFNGHVDMSGSTTGRSSGRDTASREHSSSNAA